MEVSGAYTRATYNVFVHKDMAKDVPRMTMVTKPFHG